MVAGTRGPPFGVKVMILVPFPRPELAVIMFTFEEGNVILLVPPATVKLAKVLAPVIPTAPLPPPVILKL